MMYLVVQKDTGYMDGNYTTRMWAESVAMIWRERFPDSDFEVVSVAGVPFIPDNKFLANIYYGTKDE